MLMLHVIWVTLVEKKLFRRYIPPPYFIFILLEETQISTNEEAKR